MSKIFLVFPLFLFHFSLAFAAIPLDGVTGEKLRARAFFDANNVKVGDPMVLTIDFIGAANFKDLHAPALSRAAEVDRKVWKVYDEGAKTHTDSQRVGNFFSSREVDVARRLTYRVRPMREGVLWFPVLEFEYRSPTGEKRTVRANEIPVHARPGTDVVVAEMGEDERSLPQPDALITDAGVALTDDEDFAWRRACANPTNADNFAAFDFPAAKLNEARCAILGGDWARAMKIYQRLEWRIGQTSEIERGIVAALALRYENPAAELPVWRQVGRPLLRHDWKGRVGWIGGGLTAFVLVFWLLGKVIRAVACVAVALLVVLPAQAETVETVTTNADGSVTKTKVVKNGSVSFMSSSTTGGTGALSSRRGSSLFDSDPFEMLANFDPFGRRARPKPAIAVGLAPDKQTVTVGETFNMTLSIEMPRFIALSDGVRFSIAESDQGKMQQVGSSYNLTDLPSRNPTNVIRRWAFPMRANEPFDGIHYSVESAYVFVQDPAFFRQSTPFSSGNRLGHLTVKPLENPPEGFAGIVAIGLRFEESADALRVGMNDVIRIVYRINLNGWLPEDWMPNGAAFEWGRNSDRNGAVMAEWQRYFVADGAATTPKVKVVYYDPKAKMYRTATAGGTRINYE